MLVSVENMDTQQAIVPTHIMAKNERVTITTTRGTFHVDSDGSGGILLNLGSGIDKMIVLPIGPGIQVRSLSCGKPLP